MWGLIKLNTAASSNSYTHTTYFTEKWMHFIRVSLHVAMYLVVHKIFIKQCRKCIWAHIHICNLIWVSICSIGVTWSTIITLKMDSQCVNYNFNKLRQNLSDRKNNKVILI